MAEVENVYQRLLKVQKEAVAPRAIKGRFGNARSAEQIMEAYKPVCNKYGLYLMTSDLIHTEGGRNYILSTATVVNTDKPEEQVSATAEAWEGQVVSGLDTSQVSGKTSSYAKKYALQNLFAIDDTKDADIEHSDVKVESKSFMDTKKPTENEEPFDSKATPAQLKEARTLLEKRGYLPEAIDGRLAIIETSEEANKLITNLKAYKDAK